MDNKNKQTRPVGTVIELNEINIRLFSRAMMTLEKKVSIKHNIDAKKLTAS